MPAARRARRNTNNPKPEKRANPKPEKRANPKPEKRANPKREKPELALSPSQSEAYDSLVAALRFAKILTIWGEPGFGTTTMLAKLRAEHFPRVSLVDTGSFLSAMRDRDPMALEEVYCTMLRDALAKSDALLIDDLHLIKDLTCCHWYYPRKDYFVSPLHAVMNEALAAGKRIISACRSNAPEPLHRKSYYYGVKKLEAADYAHIAQAFLPAELHARIDFAKLHRFAPKLGGHQLRAAAEELAIEPALDTTRFIDYIRARRMASNVDLSEVQSVDLRTLKGLDDVIESLEANVVLPFENDQLATKFFLIDGTVISGTRDFYEKITQITEAAKHNAPSIIFIDDSDVIFEQQREQGLYRYLLTMLDGIESESNARICVMMTAMDVGSLPPALIRSGRIELWLETRLPDEKARHAILEELMVELPDVMEKPDLAQVAKSSEGLTGADIKRIVDDAKILFAFDRARNLPTVTSTAYFERAMEALRANKQRYAEAEARVRAAAASRMPNPFDHAVFFEAPEAQPS